MAGNSLIRATLRINHGPKGIRFLLCWGLGRLLRGRLKVQKGVEAGVLISEGNRFDAGLYKMCPGERRNLVILPAFAYGQKGTSDGAIPPNATLGISPFFVSPLEAATDLNLVFDIELMGVGTTYTPLSMLSKNPVPNW
jgi:hypothetical protein